MSFRHMCIAAPIHAGLTGAAMHKKGMHGVNYLSPIANDHDRPVANETALKDNKAEKIDPHFAPHPQPLGKQPGAKQ